MAPSEGKRRWDVVDFGPFRLLVAQRRLQRDEAPIKVGSRSFDILLTLIERAPEVVSKSELLKQVWQGLTVNDGSLRLAVSELRNALGEGKACTRYVVNVPGRGYAFVAPFIGREGQLPAAGARINNQPEASRTVLPPRISKMVGREQTTSIVVEELALHRFVTIVGPGGVGKTTLAVAIGHSLAESYAHAVDFIDLGSLSLAALVPSTLASALGLAITTDDSTPAIIAFLRDQRRLLIFDSCEHLLDAIAPLAERIFEETGHTRILATSREALRVNGEHVHRLQPLACPPDEGKLTVEAALAFPAAQLLVDRARASGAVMELDDADAPILSAICRRLDGIALAIELAAGRVEAYGLRGISELLDSQLSLLWRGRRTALPRHQTLSAALDWSYMLLTPAESAVLRQVSVFSGNFSMDAAQAVASADGVDGLELFEIIASLVSKSLLLAEHGSLMQRYRQLDTTRAYVRRKLAEAGEERAAFERHALYLVTVLQEPDDAPAPHGNHLGDLRVALQWSLSDGGDPELGLALAAAAGPVFTELSLLPEARNWSERALAALPENARGTRNEMLLLSSYALSTMWILGNPPEVRASLLRSLEIAEALNDLHSQLRRLAELNSALSMVGDFEGALVIATKCAGVARILGDPREITIADCVLCVASYQVGDLAATRRYAEAVIRGSPARRHVSMARLGYDCGSHAFNLLAETLWLQGYPDRAVAVIRQALATAREGYTPNLFATCLNAAARIHLLVGDWETADKIISEMITFTEKHLLWQIRWLGLCQKGRLLIARGDTKAGAQLLLENFEILESSGFVLHSPRFAPELSESLLSLDQADVALEIVERLLVRVPDQMFETAELWRAKGRILATSPGGDIAKAMDCLQRSLTAARSQDLLSLELRTAMTIVELAAAQRLPDYYQDDAVKLLRSVYQRFTEGFATVDLLRAKQNLETLRRA